MKKALSWKVLVFLTILFWYLAGIIGGIIGGFILILESVIGIVAVIDMFFVAIRTGKPISSKNTAAFLATSIILFFAVGIGLQLKTETMLAGAGVPYVLLLSAPIVITIAFFRSEKGSVWKEIKESLRPVDFLWKGE